MLTGDDMKIFNEARARGFNVPVLSVDPIEIWVHRAKKYLELLEQVCNAWNIGDGDAARMLHLIADHYGVDVDTLATARCFVIPGGHSPIHIVMDGREVRLDQFRIMADAGEMLDVWIKYLPGGWAHIDEAVFVYLARPAQVVSVRQTGESRSDSP